MPKPTAGEDQSTWMGRCVPTMLDEGKPQDQAVAICLQMWRDKAADGDILYKAAPAEASPNGAEFILSDETIDHMDDVIALDGWDLAQFKKNPIALFSHNTEFPIGRWKNIRIENGALRAQLDMAEANTSPRIDELRSLIRQGILRGVSVGFRAIDRKPRENSKRGGVHFLKQRLVEASIVSVPANPSALSVAKSMNISRDTLDLVFGKSAIMTRDLSDRGSPGKSAAKSAHQGNGKMTTISERIESAQQQYLTAKGELDAHLMTLDDSNVSDQQLARTQELNSIIKQRVTLLQTLKESEMNLGAVAQPPTHQAHSGNLIQMQTPMSRPFAAPAQKRPDPIDYWFRANAILVKHHAMRSKQSLPETLRKSEYGDDEALKQYLDIVTRTATVPADTTSPGTGTWAGVLVQTSIGQFFDPLLPQTVYPGLSARGGRFTFGRAGQISLPTRSTTPTVAGSFFAQGSPIPVRQAAFAAVTLVPKKLGVITTMTREIMEHSIPAIEQLLRQAMQEDTANAIDTILLDANAATTIRPAGLQNGATTAAGTAGGGIAAIVSDVKAMIGALTTASAGNLRQPVWIMNPQQVVALQLTQNAGGEFPFETEVNQSRFRGYPLLQSTIMTAGTVMLLDAADFFSATGDEPRFDVSDQAVLHMEDTTPLAIGTPGAPATVAAPTRSLWQTDCVGIRMILDINWSMRRTGMVITRTAVTW